MAAAAAAAAAVPSLPLGEGELRLDGEQMGWMRDCDDLDLHDTAALASRLEEDGYLLLRGLLPRDRVLAGGAHIAAAMAQEGWLADAEAARIAPGLAWDSPHPPGKIGASDTQQLLSADATARVLQAPELFALFERLFDEPAAPFDFKWLRAVRPRGFSGFHSDGVYMGRGSARLTTVWIPWMDVGLTLGGLAVLSGSHRLSGFERVRGTYMAHDVTTANIDGDGWLSRDPVELLRFDQRARWLTSEYRAGETDDPQYAI